MRREDISPEALETWGKLAPKSFLAWVRKLLILLAVFLAPWALVPWRYAILYTLLILFISNEISDAIPVIVALAQQFGGKQAK